MRCLRSANSAVYSAGSYLGVGEQALHILVNLYFIRINKTEEEGFEPPVPYGTTVFKTVALNHSATPPAIMLGRVSICNHITYGYSYPVLYLRSFVEASVRRPHRRDATICRSSNHEEHYIAGSDCRQGLV